jgi:hypothetical protein
MRLILPYPSIVNKPWCVCTHPINPMGIHLLHCAHGNEHIGTHDVIHNIFATIAWNVGFHVGQQQLHAFFSTTFNSFRRWIDIMLIKYGICTLANVVITDPTWIYLLPQSCATQGFVASDAIQANERSYYNWHPTNQFLPLALEICGCLHKHVDVFLHDYANAIWSLKGIECFHLSTLVTFLRQKNLITLQKMQVSSILSRVVTIGLITSWLPLLQNTPPMTTIDLLQAIGFWHINMTDLHRQLVMDMERFS